MGVVYSGPVIEVTNIWITRHPQQRGRVDFNWTAANNNATIYATTLSCSGPGGVWSPS